MRIDSSGNIIGVDRYVVNHELLLFLREIYECERVGWTITFKLEKFAILTADIQYASRSMQSTEVSCLTIVFMYNLIIVFGQEKHLTCITDFQ